MFQSPASRPQNPFAGIKRFNFFLNAAYSGSNVLINAALGCNFQVKLTQNSTLVNMINAYPGQSGVIKLLQDGTGSRTLAYGNQYFFDGDTSFTIGTTASRNSIISWLAIDTQHVLLTLVAVNTSV